MAIKRGDIYFVHLGPTQGKEIDQKRRPAVVVSRNDINAKPLVVIVIPGGTRAVAKPVHPSEVRVDPSERNGLPLSTVFQCFQIKALDHSRFDDLPVGVLELVDLEKIEAAVKWCLNLA